MGEIRRAERILGIEGTPIESLQRHPELPAVLASEIMRQRAAQDPLGEAVASIGTPVRGVTNVQINIHAPQQVVNISPGRQDLSPGHHDPNSQSYMMVDPNDPYKMAQPEPGLPPAGATRIGTGHQGSAIYLPPGVVAVPGAMFQEVGPGGHIIQHTIPNPTPRRLPLNSKSNIKTVKIKTIKIKKWRRWRWTTLVRRATPLVMGGASSAP